MAKKSTALRVVQGGAAPRRETINIQMPRQRAVTTTKKKKHPRRHSGNGGDSSMLNTLGYPAGAGLILAYIEKNSVNVPTVPMLGRAGTLAIASWYFRKHDKRLVKLAAGFAAIAAYQWEHDGAIAGFDNVT
jgi:Flp pilus assembly protein TadB